MQLPGSIFPGVFLCGELIFRAADCQKSP
jgi:hypothetical protein